MLRRRDNHTATNYGLTDFSDDITCWIVARAWYGRALTRDKYYVGKATSSSRFGHMLSLSEFIVSPGIREQLRSRRLCQNHGFQQCDDFWVQHRFLDLGVMQAQLRWG
jgi:hypothetical protein